MDVDDGLWEERTFTTMGHQIEASISPNDLIQETREVLGPVTYDFVEEVH